MAVRENSETLKDASLPTRDLDERELDQARARSNGLALGDVVDGLYEITGVLGSGGMGTVYKARDRHLERDVALKVIHANKLGDERAVRGFLAEARAMARVRHPNVVMIHSFGAPDGRPYLVMEHVPGVNLALWSRRHGPLAPADAMVVLDPLLRGVQAIHDAGTIHRDLKPGNILIGPAQWVAVTDFGLARPVDRGEFGGPAVLSGTPAYLAPEITRREPLSASLATRIDVYALAVIAYELLAGRPPFLGPTLPELLTQHALDEPLPPSRVREELGTAFDAPLLQGLAKAPADRPPSAEVLRRALLAALEASSSARPGMRVLLVDDEASTLAAMSDLLELSFPGITVSTASNPGVALELADRFRPDLVITDLHMPGGGGMALTRALRERESLRKVPIVVVTAYGGASDWQQLRELGADRFLVKPIDFDTMVTVVRSLMGPRS
ncbi:protein kinase domain-containing protein [Paraliomyxa miuraensis]|uniref:protein kinase domain-containing protein n=1 Tax=Paraliomyxa miuraensis TaxID=376150 RepID=UPI0022552004|nr:serine/threonine-protein kinase [Paraliomyxa miuraensis]MCX4243744.1 serine/threonine-protein kinase [Paraliomyxa miuraensis]